MAGDKTQHVVDGSVGKVLDGAENGLDIDDIDIVDEDDELSEALADEDSHVIDDEEEDGAGVSATPEGDDDEGEDDDEVPYSPAAQQIAALAAQNRALEERLNQYESRVSQRATKEERQRQLDALKADNQSLESEASQLETDIEAAIEAGETKKQVELNRKLVQAEAKRLRVAERLEEAQQALEKDDADDGDAEQDQQRQPAPQPEAMKRWLNKRQWFWTDREAQAVAIIKGDELAKKFDPEKDEYYEKLDEYMKERYPNLYAQKGGERESRTDTARRSPTSPTRGAGSTSSKGKVRIGAAEKRNMLRFGLDPSNKEHIKQYARSMAKTL